MPLICRRCLLEEMGTERPLYLLIREWVDALAGDARAASDTYRARLNACQRCDQLADGMCALCGCYVELRAAKANQRCPGLPPKWGPGEEMP